ncbi:MAG TPA: SDR family oxidoreductase [Chitinophagaceae bacterium]|nr:SDR family oxidoreductase [Chitinophagaceae bacterium]
METNKTYTLITGGTSGIGYELAKIFATNGHNLILVSRDEADLTITRNELLESGIDVQIISKDLFDRQSPFDLYNEISEKGYDVEILVNNAGQGQYGEFSDTNIYRELSIIQLNISSLVVLTKLFLQDMLKKERGKILNLSSIASKTPGPLNSVYHGTKAFVQSFTQAIATEVKDKGITVTALLPGATDTDFFNKADMQQSKMVKEGKLEDAKTVAKEGYDALMRGDQMIVSGGLKNKVKVAMSNVLSDKAAAKKMHKEHKEQSPANEEK